MMGGLSKSLHYESRSIVSATAEQVFAFLDDHRNLSQHMSESSWMMAGSKMTIEVDALQGRAEGSHIRLNGRILGILLSVEEVVTEHRPPWRKAWDTIGEPRLLIIGAYRMGFEIQTRGAACDLCVFIDYESSDNWLGRWLPFFGKIYARWCTRQMANDAAAHFSALLHSSAGMVPR